MKIALLCGGPSLERGISLNSARSVMDHLDGNEIEIVPYYFDSRRRAYRISRGQLYSNTPSDFDFKLHNTARQMDKNQLLRSLKKIDLAFIAIHGTFGEDGEIQRFLEKYRIPFIGSGSKACKKAFDKHRASGFLAQNGFFTLPSALLKIYHSDHEKILRGFFAEHKIRRAIVKPSSGGSSIGVFSVSSPAKALEKVRLIFSKRMDTRVVVEPFARGREFTVILLQNRLGMPVAVLPTEIEADYTRHQIFDFRKKYLPSRQVTYHCPPRFSDDTIKAIQTRAEQLFTLFEMKDFARFDGWVLKNGQIWFSDFNPVSGMEQNSFFFQQTSRLGFSHGEVLRYAAKSACRRHNIFFPQAPGQIAKRAKPINVLFGGRTSERQVSLMSGTNVWLKLKKSTRYKPRPFLLDAQGNIWQLPYALCLNHTVEEIVYNCLNAEKSETRLKDFVAQIRQKLALEPGDAGEAYFLPKKTSLKNFIKTSPYVFIALHGGMGENGKLQKLLQEHKLKFNGSGPETSKLCMDKWLTGEFIENLKLGGIRAIPGKVIDFKLLKSANKQKLAALWTALQKQLKSKNLIIKPTGDGCSTGIVRLNSAPELAKYVQLLLAKRPSIPKNTFTHQPEIIEMPLERPKKLLLEKFVETDVLRVRANKLKYRRKTGWLEITTGLLQAGLNLKVFNPSLTIAENQVLSVEEKFQGGTGVNITPPPKEIVSQKAINQSKKLIGQLAKACPIRGYARVDAFMNVDSGKLMIIEINTLPGLTPSTVLFHQALAEKPPIYPAELLEKIIKVSGY